MKRHLYILFLTILSNTVFSQENNKKIDYDWNSIKSIKLIEVDKKIDLKNYNDINNLFINKKEISNRELIELKSVFKYKDDCCDVFVEDRKILMNIKFKNESIIFLVHLNQAALFDLRPNKFNFLTIINKKKFQDIVTELLNK
jgi:hypothetical protein